MPVGKPGRHILTRFDGEVGSFRQLILDMGELAVEQLELAVRANAGCDMQAVSRIRNNYRCVADMDMDLLESNIRLLAIYQPVANDLRFLVMLSRTAYDLERIQQEALRLADIAESHDRHRKSLSDCDIFDDVNLMGELALEMLREAMQAVAEVSEEQALAVARRPDELQHAAQAALRRLATYIMQDPRLIQPVIDATQVLKGLERSADHCVGISRNLIFAISGKDVRHLNALNLDRAFLHG